MLGRLLAFLSLLISMSEVCRRTFPRTAASPQSHAPPLSCAVAGDGFLDHRLRSRCALQWCSHAWCAAYASPRREGGLLLPRVHPARQGVRLLRMLRLQARALRNRSYRPSRHLQRMLTVIDGSHPMRIGPVPTIARSVSQLPRSFAEQFSPLSRCIVLYRSLVSCLATIGYLLPATSILDARDVVQLTTGRSRRRPLSSSTARATAAGLAGAPVRHHPRRFALAAWRGPLRGAPRRARFRTRWAAPRFVASSLGL